MRIWSNLVTVCTLFVNVAICSHYLEPSDVLQAVESSCVIATVAHAHTFSPPSEMLRELQVIFSQENVTFGIVELEGFVWPFLKELKWKSEEPTNNTHFVAFRKRKKDRSCLLSSTSTWTPPVEAYHGPLAISSVVAFVNSICDTFRTEAGYISVEGLHRLDILQNMFHVVNSSGPVYSMFSLSRAVSNPLVLRYQQWSADVLGSSVHDMQNDEKGNCNNDQTDRCQFDTPSEIPHIVECERIDMPTKKDFFHEFVKRSRPVIIRGVMQNWTALTNWTSGYFKEKYLHEEVHVKLTPNGDFEGVEKAEFWEDYQTFNIPAAVKKQLPFPDLVVVRPAGLNVNFSNFLGMINNTANVGKHRNYSAYLEYTSIPQYFPSLEEDIVEPGFVKDLLKRKHLNIWLSDGYTLGRLHFDPFDNLLFQINGQKEVTLFDPRDNTKLYEAHIQEAMLRFNRSTKQFKRKGLLDSTSMVMSPVDIRKPDFKRFPQFAGAYPMNCTIKEGEALFMPAYWWHEVMSSPRQQERSNLAVNFWYEPFFTKEFPCESCPFDVNPVYYHLL